MVVGPPHMSGGGGGAAASTYVWYVFVRDVCVGDRQAGGRTNERAGRYTYVRRPTDARFVTLIAAAAAA